MKAVELAARLPTPQHAPCQRTYILKTIADIPVDAEFEKRL
jgi:hypothetical protein